MKTVEKLYHAIGRKMGWHYAAWPSLAVSELTWSPTGSFRDPDNPPGSADVRITVTLWGQRYEGRVHPVVRA